MTEILRNDLAAGPPASSARITAPEHLASYNWLDKPTPTISVPGSPALWSPPKVALPLPPDSGLVYIDQNAARNPRSPLEPLFRALYTEHPSFDPRVVDLVTDRNNIRKLLRFVQGTADKPFQIRAEIAGEKTALLTRSEPQNTETIRSFKGFGHSFERAYTTQDVLQPGSSTGHHRILRYDFGGLKCIVRHETDGRVDDKKPAGLDDGGLSDALKTLSLSPSPASGKGKATTPSGALAVELAGKPAPLSSTLEIKTRAAHRTLDMADVAPQLWISQTPRLAVGYHRRGVFDDVRLRDVGGDIRRWETAHQADLCKLVDLLRRIIAVVKECRGRRGLVRYEGGGRLSVVDDEVGRDALPGDLYGMWEGRNVEDEGAGEEKEVEEGDVAETKEKKEEVERRFHVSASPE